MFQKEKRKKKKEKHCWIQCIYIYINWFLSIYLCVCVYVGGGGGTHLGSWGWKISAITYNKCHKVCRLSSWGQQISQSVQVRFLILSVTEQNLDFTVILYHASQVRNQWHDNLNRLNSHDNLNRHNNFNRLNSHEQNYLD